MTNSENQPEDKSPTFTKGQEVWVKAIIENPEPDYEWGIKFSRRCQGGRIWGFTHPSEIRTTEQLVQEYGASSPLKYEYTRTLNGDFAIYQVIKYTATETEAMKELNRLNREGQHFTPETPQNAEVIDHTRKLREGDKVEIVERDGRIPWVTDGFEIGGHYLVSGEDKYGEVTLYDKSRCEFFTTSWIFLDLIEPAPEPKYWLHESPKTYSIYYKGQFGRVITAMLMQKDLYTLDEAQEQCDKLNEKDENDD